MIYDQANLMPLPKGARWIPFAPDRLHELQDDLDDETSAKVIHNAAKGLSGMLEINGVLLCAVGLIDHGRGIGEVWAVIDRKRKHIHPLLLTRAVRRVVSIAAVYMGLGTVQMFVNSARTDAQDWAVALGFSLHGELTIYGHPELNHFIYSRSI